ncbi:MAG TPA: HAD-IC family P-type ATPase [Candidatus Paceibacterota bacterium]|nr:HAD-IC family P-type ATPase [Candidatus Paceibacterota bacterium]
MEFPGLTTAAAEAYQREHGYNEIVEKQESLAHKIMRRSVSPVSAMLLFAAALSFISGKIFDGCFILFLLALNVGVTVWQEHKADTAIEKLNEHLATAVRVLRDGALQTLSARLLVPGDVVELRAGDIVPADARAESVNGASANEAALTGESLPKEKNAGDTLYSGSFLAAGLATVRITKTGSTTYFGRTIAAVDTTPRKSALEKDILRISKFLSLLAVGAVLLLTAVSLYHRVAWTDMLRLDLSLAIAGVPISLPAVMTLIIALGVVGLSKKGAVVRRLSALEELANADLLLTDKTGTLTKNHIKVNEVRTYGSWDEAGARRMAALVAAADPSNAINRALAGAGAQPEIVRYVPADSERKRSTLAYRENGRVQTVSLGAPQAIMALCRMPDDAQRRFYDDVDALAKGGYRALALAVADGEQERDMDLAGLFALSDELREDASDVVRFLDENGIEVVMVTGDNRAIAREIAGKLGVTGGAIVARDALLARGVDSLTAASFRDTRAFAEILPEDKYALVAQAKRFFTVATNGDGVNDLPALKAANVSFAVKDAVDALKGAADIVLVSSGIAVMKDAFIEGRRIFARLYTYSLYRISESFRLIVTIIVLGVATGTYPLSPLQLILIALLNDIPIISLATDRVKAAHRPSKIDVRKQFSQSLRYGAIGVLNSLILFFFATGYLHLPLPVVETLFFLKLTISGHLLIYVAHTKERWWRYLPSRAVIVATSLTQAAATGLAITGFLMPAAISWKLALFAWIWSFFFMQIGEAVKARSS